MTKNYKISLEPRLLELLGPQLYTNIYYILSELISNAYDADAENVYIINKSDSIIVEDDGSGMSYENKDVERYLQVAKETRIDEQSSYTSKFKRKKMGRKGVGKLAALSVSEDVYIKTIKDGEKSGFILSRHIKENGELIPLNDDEITFEKISLHGTSIDMKFPEYSLSKSLDTIKRNILKVFPLVDSSFKIHLISGNKEVIIDSFEKEIIKDLSTLITFGNDFEILHNYYKTDYVENINDLSMKYPTKEIPVVLKNKSNQEKDYLIKMNGWIGTYKSTRNQKNEVMDFSSNFISLYANKKMGEFNILPYVGKNKLFEVYIVGQLHVDLFEETSLPDMALSNRQGYKTDDPRYIEVANFIGKELVPKISNMRNKYADLKRAIDKQKEWDNQKENEDKFKNMIDNFTTKTASGAAKGLIESVGELTEDNIRETIKEEIEKNKPQLGMKKVIDEQKKKILISHTKADKDLADIIYYMLAYNNVPKSSILYTNCDEQIARIPYGKNIYEYLKYFFVESYSDQLIFVIYVTSHEMSHSWGAVSEVGAGWITSIKHEVFNIRDLSSDGHFKPQAPLDATVQWQTTNRDMKQNLCVDNPELDIFCEKIEHIARILGYSPQNRSNNKSHLLTYVALL